MRRTGARITVNEEVIRDGEGFREIVKGKAASVAAAEEIVRDICDNSARGLSKAAREVLTYLTCLTCIELALTLTRPHPLLALLLRLLCCAVDR
jgi:hypothetical protein